MIRDAPRPATAGDALEARARRVLGGVTDFAVERLFSNVLIQREGRVVAELTPTSLRMVPDTRFEPLNLAHEDGPARLRKRLGLPAPSQSGDPLTWIGAPAPQRTCHTTADWTAALSRFGLPAEHVGRRVLVRGLGPVEPPRRDVRLQEAARELARARTAECLGELLRRTQSAVDGLPVTVSSERGQVVVRYRGRVIAGVDRHRLVIDGTVVRTADELLADRRAWSQLTSIARRETSKAAPASDAAALVSTPRNGDTTASREASSEPAGRGHNRVLLRELPADLHEAARDRAVAASARLRCERRIVPALRLEVHTPVGVLEFEPLREHATPLEVHFNFIARGGRLDGGLRLRATRDPLALSVGPDYDAGLLGLAWAAALVVYAELTCVSPAESHAPDPDAPVTRSHGGGTSSTRHSLRGARAHGGARSIRDAVRAMEAVSGHIRRLRPGFSASAHARRAAERAGVTLPDGNTWVRPHARGLVKEIRVTWPQGLALW